LFLIPNFYPKFNLLKFPWVQIGNPLLEFNTDFNSRAEFLWSHGLISDSAFESFTSICNYSQIRRQYASSGSLTPVCSKVFSQVSREISNFVDTYDVALDVCLTSLLSQSEVLNQMVRIGFFSYTFFFVACLKQVWKLWFPLFLVPAYVFLC
jgi:serine carboxypeptidase-like clade 2